MPFAVNRILPLARCWHRISQGLHQQELTDADVVFTHVRPSHASFFCICMDKNFIPAGTIPYAFDEYHNASRPLPTLKAATFFRKTRYPEGFSSRRVRYDHGPPCRYYSHLPPTETGSMPITVIYISAAILFAGAAQLHLPFGYFTVLRIVATGAFAWAFLVALNRNRAFLPWIYLLLTIAFNPVIKVPLSQEIWMIVDIAAGTLLLLSQNKIKQQSTTKIV